MARNIQFVFATGYGDGLELGSRFDGVAVVKEPYVGQDIAAAIAEPVLEASR